MHYGVWLLIFCPWLNTIDLFTFFEYNYDECDICNSISCVINC